MRIGIVELKARQIGAGGGLERLAPGEAGIVVSQSLGERLHLADFAAAIGIVGPAEARFVLFAQLRFVGCQDDKICEAEAFDHLIAIGQRFGKVLACIEEQHGDARVDLSEKVQEHDAFCAKAGDDSDVPGETALDHAFKHFLRRGTAKHAVEAHRVVFGKARGSVEAINLAHFIHGASPGLSSGHRLFVGRHCPKSKKRAWRRLHRVGCPAQRRQSRSGACG